MTANILSRVDNRNDGHGNRSRKVALPRRNVAAELKREYHELAALVVDRAVYIDTVWFWLPRYLRGQDYRVLNQHCSEVHEADDWPDDKPKPRGVVGWYYIQQPRSQAYQYLDALCQQHGGRCYISRVQVALDLITVSGADALRLGAFIDNHLIQRWHGKRLMNNSQGTGYSDSDKTAANSFKVYSDLPSKVAASTQPCAHIEWSVNGAATVRKCGIANFKDLLNINRQWHRDFWEKHLWLEAFDIEALGMLARGAQLYHKSGLGQRSGNFIRNIDRDRGVWLAHAAEIRVLVELCKRYSKEKKEPCNIGCLDDPDDIRRMKIAASMNSTQVVKDGLRLIYRGMLSRPRWADYRKALVEVPRDAFLP